MDAPDIMILALESKMTDNEIKDCIQQMMPICIARAAGFCLTISGFDADKRELWQIPEATAFMKRLVDFGLIAGLEVSTQGEGMVREELGVESLPGFGALEVWMAGTGRLASGSNDIDKATMDTFFAELNIANAKAKAICQEPRYNTGISAVGKAAQIPDGSTRHSCPKWNK